MTTYLVKSRATFDVSCIVEAESEEAAIAAALRRTPPRAVSWRSSEAPAWNVDDLGEGGEIGALTAEVAK